MIMTVTLVIIDINISITNNEYVRTNKIMFR